MVIVKSGRYRSSRIEMRLFIFLAITFPILCFGQNNMGVGTLTPDPSSILDISSNDKGVLVPRLNSLQRTSIPNPANGLLIFDTDDGCFFFYQGTTSTWVNLCNTGGIGPTGPTGPSGGPPGPAGATGATGVAGNNDIQIFSLTGQQTQIGDSIPVFDQILGLDTTIVLTDTATVCLFSTGNIKSTPSNAYIYSAYVQAYLNNTPIPFTYEMIPMSGSNSQRWVWSISKTLDLFPGTYSFKIKASKSDQSNSTNFPDMLACPCFTDDNYPIDCSKRHCNMTLQVFYR